MADEDDESFGGMYENGYWEWDGLLNQLQFVRDVSSAIAIEPMETTTILKAPAGIFDFRDNIDLLEQQRFRKRYQRKVAFGEPDLITLQDVKDVAIFMAPMALLTPKIIRLLHISTTERFMRALIFYCQYYLQVAEIMQVRILEMDTKVRTPQSDVIEDVYCDNLMDLRALVAKEYCTVVLGGADSRNFHHMGPKKKSRSLTHKDAHLFEALMRISIQIVWLALGRRSYNQIELEINRLFKTDFFNSVEHILHTGYIAKMSRQEKHVLLGKCVNRTGKKLLANSPLVNAVYCGRPLDYRAMGLGVIKQGKLSPRLQYMKMALAAPEEELQSAGVVVGILGSLRAQYDTMLYFVTQPEEKDSSSHSMKSMKSLKSMKSAMQRIASNKVGPKVSSTGSSASVSASKSSKRSKKSYAYADIILPPKEAIDSEIPDCFPSEPEAPQPRNLQQQERWLGRLRRLMSSSTRMKTRETGVGVDASQTCRDS